MKNSDFYFVSNNDRIIKSYNNETDDLNGKNNNEFDMDIESTIFNLLPFNSRDNFDDDNNFNNYPKDHDKLMYDMFNSVLMDDINLHNDNNHYNDDKKYELKQNNKSKELIDRISLFETNYFNNNVEKENNINKCSNVDILNGHHDKFHESKCHFKYNLKLAENSLPGAIINYMHDTGRYLSLDEIIQFISPKFSSLRKSNGSMYKVSYIILH